MSGLRKLFQRLVRTKSSTLSPLFVGTLLWLVLVATHSVEAQTYNWNPVQIHGGGIVRGISLHPAEPGLMYCRTDVGGSYRWNPANDTWNPLLDFLGHPQPNGDVAPSCIQEYKTFELSTKFTF